MKNELLPHLFRSEFGKIVSVLGKHFSLEHLEVAEDIASETFLLAMETWPYKGMPDNPTAWLYTVAKNKAKNFLHRHKVFHEKVLPVLGTSSQHDIQIDIDLSNENISDSQLKMLFALCNPSINRESQVGLCLRVLCGFGIDEIATAFLSNRETIIKRLQRARDQLRAKQIDFHEVSERELPSRLERVVSTLYLLFNEGYHSETQDSVLREELCQEAMRLLEMLTQNPRLNTPEVNAALALMYFHASRFEARKGRNGELILYDDQDRNLWRKDFVAKGAYHLHIASTGSSLSRYHLEAAIAYWHTVDTDEKWENILQL